MKNIPGFLVIWLHKPYNLNIFCLYVLMTHLFHRYDLIYLQMTACAVLTLYLQVRFSYNQIEHIVITQVILNAYAMVLIWESYVGFIVGIKIAKNLAYVCRIVLNV